MRRVLTWLVTLTVGSLALPAVARAHNHLQSSSPASGARLAVAPRELRLTFNEAVELAVSRLELLAPDGHPVALSALRIDASPATIVAGISGALGAGTYTVAWQVAGRDGHPVRGRFRFTITPGAAGIAAAADTVRRDTATTAARSDSAASRPPGHHGPTTMPPRGSFDVGSPAFVAARWLAFVATLALIGAVGFARAVVPRALRAGAPAAPLERGVMHARTLGRAAAAGLLVASLLRLAAQSAAMHGAADAFDPGLVTTMVRHTTWGVGWLVQVGAALVALAGLVLARRSAAGWTLAAVAVVAVAVGAALSGHAAAVPTVTALAVAADAIHVLGAGGWLGTLLALVAVGLPSALRAAEGQRGPAAAALVGAFSPVALTCAGVLAASGLAAAWWHVGHLAALWTSTYGRILLLKLALLVVIAGLGAYHWRRLGPSMGDERSARHLRRSATAELLIGAAVLAITAVLVAIPTPMDTLR